MAEYVVYDVFTDTAFGGNPLAVVTGANDLPEAQLQRIAREFNFSETTFVFPPEDPENTARVRIFTPASELPFAGHPIVGTAIALADLGRTAGDMVLELGVGPIPVTLAAGKATFETRVPLAVAAGPGAVASAGLVGLGAEDIRTTTHQPVNAGVGLPFLIAELRDMQALASAVPDTNAFRARIDEGAIRMGVFVYVREGSSIRARMFAPHDGMPEDPATGSAAAALTALLGQLEGRSSLIEAAVEVDGGQPVAVSICGSAVKVMEGRLTF